MSAWPIGAGTRSRLSTADSETPARVGSWQLGCDHIDLFDLRWRAKKLFRARRQCIRYLPCQVGVAAGIVRECIEDAICHGTILIANQAFVAGSASGNDGGQGLVRARQRSGPSGRSYPSWGRAVR